MSAFGDKVNFVGRWDLRNSRCAVTVNSGSSIRVRFSASSLSAQFDLSLNRTPLPTIAWKIDDHGWQESELAPAIQLAEGLPIGPHTLWLMVRGIDENQNRWTRPLVASVSFTGILLPDGGSILPPLEQWQRPKLTMEFLGDSITEGVLVTAPRPGKDSWSWQTDALHSHACQTALLLGADWRQVGFGATGLAHEGSGGAPGALDTFNFFHAECPRDDWQPDVVVINQGTNDSGMNPDAYAPLYAKYLALVRHAYPEARIAAVRPFSGAQADSIKTTVDAVRQAGDNKIHYIDTTGWHSGDLHPNAADSRMLAGKLAAVLKSDVISG